MKSFNGLFSAQNGNIADTKSGTQTLNREALAQMKGAFFPSGPEGSSELSTIRTDYAHEMFAKICALGSKLVRMNQLSTSADNNDGENKLHTLEERVSGVLGQDLTNRPS